MVLSFAWPELVGLTKAEMVLPQGTKLNDSKYGFCFSGVFHCALLPLCYLVSWVPMAAEMGVMSLCFSLKEFMWWCHHGPCHCHFLLICLSVCYAGGILMMFNKPSL